MIRANRKNWKKLRNGVRYLGWPDSEDMETLFETFDGWEPDKRYTWTLNGPSNTVGDWPRIEPETYIKVDEAFPDEIASILVPVLTKPSKVYYSAIPEKYRPKAPDQVVLWTNTEPGSPKKPTVNRGDAGVTLEDYRKTGRSKKSKVQMKSSIASERMFERNIDEGRKLYSPQIRPTKIEQQVQMANETAIASDWTVFDSIQRFHAVTFRADTRSPHEIIVKEGGFVPNALRTDKYYLENDMAYQFQYYLQKRFSIWSEIEPIQRAIKTHYEIRAAKK